MKQAFAIVVFICYLFSLVRANLVLDDQMIKGENFFFPLQGSQKGTPTKNNKNENSK